MQWIFLFFLNEQSILAHKVWKISLEQFFFKINKDDNNKKRKRTANVSDVLNPKKHESSPFNAHKSHQMHDFVCVANSHTMFKLDWM